MNITVLYFASLADKAQKDQEKLDIDCSTNLRQLYQQLQQSNGFQLEAEQLRVAINDEFAEWTDAINEGDTIAFIPPVAGG